MLARLWWKEFRLFWPVWLCISLFALVGQWLALWFFGNEARTGVLMLVALGWAFLYATAVSSAAFAGEREQRTLRFLDTLPVPRGFLWQSKASFALVSTLVFGLLLLLIGVVSTDFEAKQAYFNPAGSWSNFFSCLVLLIEVLGWGLFWSAIMGNPLSASAMTVASVGVVVPLLMRHADLDPTWWSDAIVPRLVVAALTTLASLLILTRKPTPSPLPRPERVRGVRSREPRPRASRPSKPPRFWLAATRSIVWETIREMRAPLAFVILAMFVVPFFFVVSGNIDPIIADVIGVFATIGAGVNVFGAENRGRTFRFLAHHGVGPGVVWTFKMGLWCFAMVCIWIPAFYLLAPMASRGPDGDLREDALILLAVWIFGFSAAQLCGMVIKRGITAALVAFMLALLILLPIAAMYGFGLISVWQAAAIPLGLILISRIWCGDWLNDRPGTRPWIKLGLSFIGVFGLMFASYVRSRTNEIPVLSPPVVAELLAASPPKPINPAKNAAPLYLEAERKLSISDDASYHEGIDLLRQASTLPYCRFADAGQRMMTEARHSNNARLSSHRFLSFQFERVIRDEFRKGTLDKAWSDILALLRIGRHFQIDLAMTEAMEGLDAEMKAMALAVEWASDTRQTAELIARALKDLKALPPPTPAENAIREEWALMKRTVELPKDRLRGIMESAFFDWFGGDGFFARGLARTNWSAGMSSLVMTPWEVERAGRVVDELFAAKVLESRSEPWRRFIPSGVLYRGWEHAYYQAPDSTFYRSPWQLESDLRTTPIVKFLYFPIDTYLRSSDRTEAMRRGLLQFVALRSWQFKHDGNLPEKLSDIVPSELEKLPGDPFSNRAFAYLRSQGELIYPLHGNPSVDEVRESSWKVEGRRLLMSTGEDRQILPYSGQNGSYENDIVFVLPAAKNDPPVAPRPGREIPRVENANPSGMGAMMGGMVGEDQAPEPKLEEKEAEAPRN